VAVIEITQAEADSLIAMEKRFVDDTDWTFPAPGERIGLALTSLDKRENFTLDVTRAQIKLTKATYQNRARQAIILMRLDLDSPPHRNPDGTEIPCPYLHIYREGFGDRWAIAAPVDRYTNTLDLFSLRSLLAALQYHWAFQDAERAIFLSVVEIEQLLHNYRSWLRDKTTLRELNGEWIEITTPYLDRHNDALQIYVRSENGGYVLTDDRYTIHDLEASGCNLHTDKRQDLLKMTLNGFGVRLSEEALEVHATAENFPLKKHSLTQAMLAVNDLFYLTKPVVESLFFEDVVSWLEANEIRYTPEVKFTGVSGYDHLFNFVIPKSRKQPERIVQAINRPTRETGLSFINPRSGSCGPRSGHQTAGCKRLQKKRLSPRK
jgi:hypothetical protein